MTDQQIHVAQAEHIAGFLGMRVAAVEKFITDNALDAQKLANNIVGDADLRFDIVCCIVGYPSNEIVLKIIDEYKVREKSLAEN